MKQYEVTPEIELEQTEEFYKFLQGELPEGMEMNVKPKMSERGAFRVIWYLQEHLRIFPDNFERCCSCGLLFDMRESGGMRRGRTYCDTCY